MRPQGKASSLSVSFELRAEGLIVTIMLRSGGMGDMDERGAPAFRL
jgi:hypothetical protein